MYFSLFLLLNTTNNTMWNIYIYNKYNKSLKSGKKTELLGSQDVRKDTVASSLGFLFCQDWICGSHEPENVNGHRKEKSPKKVFLL